MNLIILNMSQTQFTQMISLLIYRSFTCYVIAQIRIFLQHPNIDACWRMMVT